MYSMLVMMNITVTNIRMYLQKTQFFNKQISLKIYSNITIKRSHICIKNKKLKYFFKSCPFISVIE